MALSFLFALAALAAVAVIARSLLVGSARARLILAELAEIENRAFVTRSSAALRPLPPLRPRLAVA